MRKVEVVFCDQRPTADIEKVCRENSELAVDKIHDQLHGELQPLCSSQLWPQLFWFTPTPIPPFSATAGSCFQWKSSTNTVRDYCR